MALTNLGLVDVQSGSLEFQGGYSQTGGQLNFGLASPTQFGRVVFGGPEPQSGILSANLLGGYQPSSGDTFDLLTYASASGSFDSFHLPALANGAQWVELSSATRTTLKVVGPSPGLTFSFSAGGLSLYWPAGADAGYVLQYTTNLAPPVVWQTATNSAQVSGDQHVVTISAGDGSMFFQLRE
jgi:hypothetical protein